MPGTTGTFAPIASWRAAVLLPIAAIASAGGPMNDEPGVAHGAREPLALGEESVAGMNRLGADALRGLDDAVALEVALADGGAPMCTASSASRTCGARASASL